MHYRIFGTIPQGRSFPYFNNIHAEDVGKVERLYKDFVCGSNDIFQVEFRVHPFESGKPSAGTKWIQSRAIKVKYGRGQAVIAKVMDITRIKELEALVGIEDKMSSLGRVASGIAHEMRNPISALNVYLAVMQETLAGSMPLDQKKIDTLDKACRRMQEASNRIDSIIRKVMDFAKPSTPQMVFTNLNRSIQKIIGLSETTLRKNNISLTTDLYPNLPKCLVDPHLIEQVLMNLLNNSVRVLQDYHGKRRIEIASQKSHGAIIVQVSDSGPGVSEDIQTVVSAIKLGAYNYVVKPVNLDALKVEISNALESIRLRMDVQRLQEKYLSENLPFFIGESRTIQEVKSLVAKIARSPDASILILGETGTGKELIASTIHYKSPNFREPFITLNCLALPDNLVESELFGYEKGAFSGANPGGKKGLIEAAGGGTLFLDEVGDLSPGAQAKLLRFLESGEFFKVGGIEKHTVKTRVVSATNKDFEELIDKGLFREDLYFRLATIRVEIPSLNERRDDIMPIANHFLVQFSEKLNKPFTRITPRAAVALMSHPWKGNIRELRNMIERAVLVGEGPDLRLQDLGINESNGTQSPSPFEAFEIPGQTADGPAIPPEGVDMPAIHRSLDIHYIRRSLEMAHGNAARAAELLNISYHAFRRRRAKLDI